MTPYERERISSFKKSRKREGNPKTINVTERDKFYVVLLAKRFPDGFTVGDLEGLKDPTLGKWFGFDPARRTLASENVKATEADIFGWRLDRHGFLKIKGNHEHVELTEKAKKMAAAFGHAPSAAAP